VQLLLLALLLEQPDPLVGLLLGDASGLGLGVGAVGGR